MAQDLKIIKKKTGRPPGRTRPPTKPVQAPVETIAEIDAWIAAQPEPKPSRPEAISRLVEKGLKR